MLLAGALLAVGLYQVAFTAHAYRGRDRAFPRLCDFETQWERRFVYGQDASLALRPRPESWSGPSSDDAAGYVTFYPPDYVTVVGASFVEPSGDGFVDIPAPDPGPFWDGANSTIATLCAVESLSRGHELYLRKVGG